MKVLYHFPNEDSVYAARTIAFGYKHAFEKKGHDFRFLTSKNWNRNALSDYKPNMFITGLGKLGLKYLNLDELEKAKKRGTKVFVNTPFWNSPFTYSRINEEASLSDNAEYVNLIKSGAYGDYYYNSCEEGDPRMDGFTRTTGYPIHTVLLAADEDMYFFDYSRKFDSDISYIGTNLPGKRKIYSAVLFPLKKLHLTKVYGQDWTIASRFISTFNKIGQYFNIDILRKLRVNNTLQLEDERKIYSSSKINLNFHEPFQVQYGDLNERTFKIPLSGGFQICDNVISIQKYFNDGESIVLASTVDEWYEKVEYYLEHKKERETIIEVGRKIVKDHHTYSNRVDQLLGLYKH